MECAALRAEHLAPCRQREDAWRLLAHPQGKQQEDDKAGVLQRSYVWMLQLLQMKRNC